MWRDYSGPMSDTLTIAQSGLRAAAATAAVAADNLVNARSASPAGEPYRGHVPREPVATSVQGGGVSMSLRAVDPAAFTVAGTAYPNVDEATEILRLKTAERSYGASAALVRTEESLGRTLLDITG